MCDRLTIERAKTLSHGEMLHDRMLKNADGTPQRWRVSGRPKVWKTRPDEVRVPVKRGMYQHSALTHDNLNELRLGSGTEPGHDCTQCEAIPFGEWEANR